MKLGFVSAILDTASFEEVIDAAASYGFECVEMACWPVEKASRRYAGVTHINIEELNEEKIAYINNYCQDKHITISALAYYPNTLTEDMQKRAQIINHLIAMIKTAPKLNVHMITTFIGRVQSKTIEENLEIFKEIWTPIIRIAEEYDVKIAIENCPMLFGPEQWPGGQNLMTTPAIWKKAFELIPSDHFGLNYDPSHFIWQQIDYIKPIYQFKNKIFHAHCKDIKLFKDKLDQVGIMAYPLDYMSPKLPGLGDVDWGRYISALTDIHYEGYICIEIEDKAFEGTREKIHDSLKLSHHYLQQFII